jgi:hypothetical protein
MEEKARAIIFCRKVSKEMDYEFQLVPNLFFSNILSHCKTPKFSRK